MHLFKNAIKINENIQIVQYQLKLSARVYVYELYFHCIGKHTICQLIANCTINPHARKHAISHFVLH